MNRTAAMTLALILSIPGCDATLQRSSGASGAQQSRFKGMGPIFGADAVPGAEMRGVAFYDDRGVEIVTSSLVAKRNRGIFSLGNGRVPLWVRVIWRENPKAVWGKDGGIDFVGNILGDYTIPVAERIPEDVLNDIRARGGALRLKFRLKPDGVMFGWDIERHAPIGDVSVHVMPGGDFLETRF